VLLKGSGYVPAIQCAQIMTLQLRLMTGLFTAPPAMVASSSPKLAARRETSFWIEHC